MIGVPDSPAAPAATQPADRTPTTPLAPAPVVALPSQGLSGAAIGAMVVAAAAMLLVTLNLRRTTTEDPLLATSGTASFSPAPPLSVPPAPVPDPVRDGLPPAPRMFAANPMASSPHYRFRPPAAYGGGTPYAGRYAGMSPGSTGMLPAAAMPPPYVPGQDFRASGGAAGSGRGNDAASGSALVIDIGGAPGGTAGPASDPAAAARPTANRPIRATLMTNRASLVAEGTIIDATLETSIDSTRPGLIRAIVGEDVRGFDGRRIVIPRGSRLTGEYRADVQSGQRRVLATWTRLIRPDGVAVRIDSPAADRIGGSGIPGVVHSNFLQRFASAVLQSALNIGVNLASRSNGSTVIIGPAGGNMTQILPTPEARRSIRVAAGKPVSVFVAHDLDFSDVPGWR